MFGMCSIFLFIASVLQRRLEGIAESQKSSKFPGCPGIPICSIKLNVSRLNFPEEMRLVLIEHYKYTYFVTGSQDWTAIRESDSEAEPLNVWFTLWNKPSKIEVATGHLFLLRIAIWLTRTYGSEFIFRNDRQVKKMARLPAYSYCNFLTSVYPSHQMLMI